ncbi:DNA repair protein complementing XP-C cells [Protopterus annectens]|uniref:DNA repair protein complementing XP-C cells n=1 Tax=Protopterus annectens TaxID=7888 RepID=UPI001CFA0595|nr:DNA repair protein complementing XP-C cells [Protopterus annectens]
MPKRITSSDTSVKAQSKKAKQNPGPGLQGESVTRKKVKTLGDTDAPKSKKTCEPKSNQKCLGKRKIKSDFEEKPAKVRHLSDVRAPEQSRTKSKKKKKLGVKEEPGDVKQKVIFKGFPSIPKCEEVYDKDKSIKTEGDEDESEDEWEDVEDLHEVVSEVSTGSALTETTLPANPVEIEIETPEQAKKREKREKRKAEFEMYLRRMLNRFKKELRIDTHKVHLLCLIANGIFRNRICNNTNLQAIALSLIPAQFTKLKPARIDLLFLTNLVRWFVSVFSLNTELSVDNRESIQSRLERRLGNYSVKDEEELVHVFLVILRALQLMCRLVLSLQPVPLKEATDKDKKSPGSCSRKSLGSSRKTQSSSKRTASSKLVKNLKEERSLSDDSEEDAEMEEEKQQTSIMKKGATNNSKPRTAAKKIKLPSSIAVKSESKEVGLGPKNDRRRSTASKVCYKEESENDDNSDSDFELSDADGSSFSDDMGKAFASKQQQTGLQKKKILKKGKNESSISGKIVSESSVGSNAAVEEPKETLPKVKKLSSKNNKIISSDEDEDGNVLGQTEFAKGVDHWLEVYVEREEKWVCIDCVHGSVSQPQLCYKYATKPIFYIIGIDNEGFVRDITQRYDAAWMTVTRKLRVDPAWWQETLEPYRSPFNKREEKEDLQLQAKLLDQPLPKSINEYKNHPLYSLKRHLLKFQAIYPSTASILGYCRGEAVYARDCVHTLHSRDTWLKEARVVRLGEVPYKMVKGQSNRSRKARLAEPENSDKDDLALFGLWQTEEYQPPVAVDGKVPRNEYGNVYLFKSCMLPIGCVHLQVPSLHRVARKLNIDCAAAITGFDFHAGYSHPVVDGYVVCEEYKDILLTAWENEQAEIERKEKEKREKRVLANWKLLVKGLLIRERLKQRYGNKDGKVRTIGQGGGGFSSDEEEEEEEPSSQTAANDASCSWPENRKAEEQESSKIGRMSKREKKGEEKNLFPFEK